MVRNPHPDRRQPSGHKAPERRRLENKRQRTRPEFSGEAIRLRRNPFDQGTRGLKSRDEKRQGFTSMSAFQCVDALDPGKRKHAGPDPVDGLCRENSDASRLQVGGQRSQNLGGQGG